MLYVAYIVFSFITCQIAAEHEVIKDASSVPVSDSGTISAYDVTLSTFTPTETIVNNTELIGNEANEGGLQKISCQAVSNFTVEEFRQNNETILSFSWNLIGNFNESNICVEVKSYDSKCSRPKICNVSDLDTISGLCSNHMYNFVVTTVCEDQQEAQKTLIYQTKPGEPSAPRDLTVIVKAATILHISWAAPAIPNGPIHGYILTCWKNDTSDKEIASPDFLPNITSYKINNLNHGTTYIIKLSAYNKFDSSLNLPGPAAIITAATKVLVPEPPRNLIFRNVTNTSVIAAWDSPNSGNVLHYTIHVNKSAEYIHNITDTFCMLDNLEPYNFYNVSVSAGNTHGSSIGISKIVRTDVGKPDVPQNVKIIETGAKYILFTWKSPKRKFGNIDGYTVKCTQRNSATPPVVHALDGKTKEFRILSLSSWRVYDIELSAYNTNNEGYNISSMKVILSQRTLDSIPDSPKDLMFENVANNSLRVLWKPPESGSVLQYSVQVNISLEAYILNTTDTFCQLIELKCFTYYNVSIRASNTFGSSAWTSSILRTDVGTPDVPQNVEVTIVESEAISVYWKSPKKKNGNIDGYTIKYSKHDSTFLPSDSITLDGSIRKYRIRNIQPWTLYYIKLSAFNINSTGQNLYSEEALIMQKTLEGSPSNVTDIIVLFVSNTSITVRWRPPSKPAGIIIHYIIQLFYNSLLMRTIRSNETYIVLGKLMPYTTYSFSITAETAGGQGNYSEAVFIKTDVGEPDAPEDLEVQHIEATELSIIWKKPSYKAGPIDGYLLTWYKVHDSKRTRNSTQLESTEFILTDLDPYTDYSINVQAYNSDSDKESIFGKPAGVHCKTAVALPNPAEIISIQVQSSMSVWIEWELPGVSPGPTRYVVGVWQKAGICQKPSEDKFVRNNTKDNMTWTTVVIRNLEPYTEYFFEVIATTEAGSSTSNKSRTVRTYPDVPSQPQSFQVNCSYSSISVMLSWTAPEETNGLIEKYRISYGNTDQEAKSKVYPIKPVITCGSKIYMTEITWLNPDVRYIFTIEAKTKDVEQYGTEAHHNNICVLPVGVPPIPDNSSKPAIQEVSINEVTLKLSNSVFSNEMGRIMYYSVIVATPDVIGVPSNGTINDTAPSLPVWSEFYKQNSNIYQATPKYWNPFHNKGYDPLNCHSLEDSMLQCTVGWEKNCSSNDIIYCNGPLEPGKVYGMKLRGYTKAGYAETYPLFVKTNSVDNSVVLGLSVGLGLTIVLLLTIFGITFYMKKNRKTFDKNRIVFFFRKSPDPNHDSTVSLSVIPNGKINGSKVRRPFNFSSFVAHIQEMMSDSALKFSLEYEDLKHNSPRHPCTSAELEENRCKNRWTNILPFDHSRVKLLPIDDEPGSDYINASYIPGFSSHREYIASQGPLPSTIDDFWRMIWEQKITTIVMLTQCVERGKTKCEQYWPRTMNETMYYGDLEVQLISESKVLSYITRTFTLTLGTRQCVVNQMHYICWPDFGCPESPEALVAFVKAVEDQFICDSGGPILVHCSAGVGRTGTFIAVHRLMQHVQCHNDVDIYNTVKEMREHRTNMVQTEDQYIYIHKCLSDIIVGKMNCDADNCDKSNTYFDPSPVETTRSEI